MVTLRRNIFNAIPDDKQYVKALALAIFIKRTYKSSMVTNYSIYKLHLLTGLHASTLSKRLRTLKQLGFIEYVGKNREHLVIKSMSSHNKNRNIDISNIIFDDVKTIEKSLLALVVVEIQKRKNFAKQIINTLANPKDVKEYKNAKRLCRLFGWGHKYNENGISYKRIAKEMGVSIQKAVGIIKFAVAKEFLNVRHRQMQKYCRGIGSMVKHLDLKGYTFCTKDNIYVILANEYSLGNRLTLRGNY
jgi:DNA-binding MarR family transcriptional regulator